MAPANLVDSILMKEMCVYIYGTLALKKSRNNGSEGGGGNVMITIFGDFDQFCVENWRFSWNAMWRYIFAVK
jgi:hypothetical protein